MMNSIKRNGWWIVLSSCILVWVIQGCGKVTDGPYYGYENKIHSFDGTVYEFLQSQPDVYDSLLYILGRLPDIEDSLKSEDSITLVAPSNSSFTLALEGLNAIRTTQHKTLLYLADLDSTNLDSMMTKYVLRGDITTADADALIDGIDVYGIKYDYNMHFEMTTSNASGVVDAGPNSLTVADKKNSWLTADWVTTTTSAVDIQCSNGVIHTLITSHVFGWDDFSTIFNK